MSKRPYRLIHGVGYPYLMKGDNPTRVVQADMQDRHGLYYDQAIMLSEGDLERFGGIVGKPLRVEHGQEDVGVITRAWKDREGKLRINAHVWLDTKYGMDIDERIQNGALCGLSVGYDSHVDTSRGLNEITHKTFNEISICEQGFFPGAAISVFASNCETNSKKYKCPSESERLLRFSIMASNETPVDTTAAPTQEAQPTTSVPPSAPVPVTQDTPKAAQELLSEMDKANTEKDDLVRQLEELRKKNKERDERLAYFEKQEAIKEARRLEEAQKQAVATMASLKEAGIDISDQVANGMTACFANPELESSKQFFSVIASQLAEKKKMEEEKQKLNAELEELRKARDASSKFVQQTHASILGLKEGMSQQERDQAEQKEDAEQEKIALEASSNMGFASVFVQSRAPSNDERQLIGGVPRGSTPVVGVNASNMTTKYTSNKLKRLPQHGFEVHCPGSLARNKATEAMWTYVFTQDQKYGTPRSFNRRVNNPADVARFETAYNAERNPGSTANMKWYNDQ